LYEHARYLGRDKEWNAVLEGEVAVLLGEKARKLHCPVEHRIITSPGGNSKHSELHCNNEVYAWSRKLSEAGVRAKRKLLQEGASPYTPDHGGRQKVARTGADSSAPSVPEVAAAAAAAGRVNDPPTSAQPTEGRGGGSWLGWLFGYRRKSTEGAPPRPTGPTPAAHAPCNPEPSAVEPSEPAAATTKPVVAALEPAPAVPTTASSGSAAQPTLDALREQASQLDASERQLRLLSEQTARQEERSEPVRTELRDEGACIGHRTSWGEVRTEVLQAFINLKETLDTHGCGTHATARTAEDAHPESLQAEVAGFQSSNQGQPTPNFKLMTLICGGDTFIIYGDGKEDAVAAAYEEARTAHPLDSDGEGEEVKLGGKYVVRERPCSRKTDARGRVDTAGTEVSDALEALMRLIEPLIHEWRVAKEPTVPAAVRALTAYSTSGTFSFSHEDGSLGAPRRVGAVRPAQSI